VTRRYPFLHLRGEVYYFFWSDNQGKRREESLRTKDAETAATRYAQRQREIGAGRMPTKMGDWPLERAVTTWIEHRRLRVSRGTLKAEITIARNLVREFGGQATLRSLADMPHVRSYQDARLKAGISAKTVNNEIQEFAGILKLAEMWQRIGQSYRPLRVRKSDLPDALTREESARLLTLAAEYDPISVAPNAAVLAFSTGLRIGEIKGLRLADLHHDERQPFLYVRRATTKTDSGARRVALDRIAVWAVQRLLARARLLGCMSPEHYLLPTDRARHTRLTDPLHGPAGFDPSHPQSSWESEWKRFRIAAGIGHRRFHDLRHTYVTRAAEAGVPIAVLQAQVGHLSVAMIERYTHICQQAQYQAARRIENDNPALLACLGLPRDDSSIGQTSNQAKLGRQPERVAVVRVQ
jgi:integrase